MSENIVILTCNMGGRGKCRCQCPTSCDHAWDGPIENREEFGGGFSSAGTCSKCGMNQMDHDQWVLP